MRGRMCWRDCIITAIHAYLFQEINLYRIGTCLGSRPTKAPNQERETFLVL